MCKCVKNINIFFLQEYNKNEILISVVLNFYVVIILGTILIACNSCDISLYAYGIST